METINLILIFTAWSVTSIVVNGSIFDGVRNYFLVKSPFFGKLLSCVMCLSVWVGTLIFIPALWFDVAIPLSPGSLPDWANYFIFPIITSGFSVLLESFIIFLVKRNPA